MLKMSSENFKQVFLWIQGIDVFHYYNQINNTLKNIEIIPPSIEAFDNILMKRSIGKLDFPQEFVRYKKMYEL